MAQLSVAAAPTPTHVLEALRSAAAAPRPAAALICLAWLGDLLALPLQPAAATEGAAPPSGGATAAEAEAVLAALRSEPLLPTADGRWVAAPPADQVVGAGGGAGAAEAAAQGPVVAVLDSILPPASAAGTGGGGLRLRDEARAASALLQAAAAQAAQAAEAWGAGAPEARRQLELIGPVLAGPHTEGAHDDLGLAAPAVAVAAAAGGLSALLCGLLGLPRLSGLVVQQVALSPAAAAALQPPLAGPHAVAAVTGPAKTSAAADAAARAVLQRLNDVAPYVLRWAAAYGGGAGVELEEQEGEEQARQGELEEESPALRRLRAVAARVSGLRVCAVVSAAEPLQLAGSLAPAAAAPTLAVTYQLTALQLVTRVSGSREKESGGREGEGGGEA